MAHPAVSSRMRALLISRRCFATYNSLNNAAESSSSGSSSSKGEEIDETMRSLYKNSKAASRPRANARSPLYAGLPSDKRHSKKSSGPRDHDESMNGPYTAALNSPLARADETLRNLYTRLDGKAQEKNAVECVKICNLIKERLQMHSSNDETRASPPIYVYQILLKRLSEVGAYEYCLQVIKDMESVGHTINVEVLNHQLKAAVERGKDEEVEETLQTIASLNNDFDTAQSSSSNQDATILPVEWTKNWTATTYGHLLRRCHLSHNLDYALLLLGSASHRQKEGGDDASFLSDVMHHTPVMDLIFVVTHAREARLAVELAEWLHGGIASRKLHVRTWMTVLRCCAEQGYVPGIRLAWKRAVVEGLLTPDDGVVIMILNAAARDGHTDLIEQVLDFHKGRLAQARLTLQEWHLAPLFDSHCYNRNFVPAIQAAMNISRMSGVALTAAGLLPLKNAAKSSVENLKAAYEAFLFVGRDSSTQGGVSVAILNCLLLAANQLNKFAMVFNLYRARNLVRSEDSPQDCALPPLPNSDRNEEEEEGELVEFKDDMEVGGAEEAKGKNTEKEKSKDGKGRYQHSLKADVDTYNELLYSAVLQSSPTVGQIVFRHLNANKVKANERTYELAVRLEITKDDYQDSFRLLEECKKRRMVPTRWAYLAIARRCLDENDPRWVGVAREMLENDHGLGDVLYNAMVEEGYLDPNLVDRSGREIVE